MKWKIVSFVSCRCKGSAGVCRSVFKRTSTQSFLSCVYLEHCERCGVNFSKSPTHTKLSSLSFCLYPSFLSLVGWLDGWCVFVCMCECVRAQGTADEERASLMNINKPYRTGNTFNTSIGTMRRDGTGEGWGVRVWPTLTHTYTNTLSAIADGENENNLY